ncbi:STAS domain-containing protein [Streptomyces althioticus]|uniref:STAS domain-containing protein n=1 Tax=Streptomyces althioticus TaxID=83380 RepID=UPI0033C800E0
MLLVSEALDTTVRYTGNHTAVIVVTGDVDLHTAPVLRVEALTAMTRGARHLVLDMAEVDFVDSTGLSTLIVLLHATQEPGGSLRVARVPERLVRMVTMTGIAELLPVHDTVEDALAALHAEEGAGDVAGHEGVDGAANRGGDASAPRPGPDGDASADLGAPACADRGAHASATPRADRGADMPVTTCADRGLDGSVTAPADLGAPASATACADRGAHGSVTASAHLGADVSAPASADRGAPASAPPCADLGADASAPAPADRGVDDAVGGAGPSR